MALTIAQHERKRIKNAKVRNGSDANVHTTRKQRETGKLLARRKLKYFMFYGGSRSGKTFYACLYIRHRARTYAGSKHLVARYSFANAKKTVWLHTLYPLLKEDEANGLCHINKSEGICEYYNGSLIVLGGLEPSRIDSVLAAEYATIFVTEANENRFEDVQMLFTRLNDRSKSLKDGSVIKLKFIIDLNPTTKTHWTNLLFRMGINPITRQPIDNFDEYCAVHFKPEDNKSNLADGYIESLKSLSPSMKRRFYEGIFGEFEGLVINIDESVHIVDDFIIPKDWRRWAAVDFGYTHPFGTLYGAYDESNETLYIYREYKVARRTVRVHSQKIKEDCKGEIIHRFVADHDAEDRATLEENGIITDPANKNVLEGIDKMIDIFHNDDNKKTNIKIFRSCIELINELLSYRWKDSEMSSRNAKDREVVKEDDHLIDCLRYMIMDVFEKVAAPGFIFSKEEKDKIKEMKKRGK